MKECGTGIQITAALVNELRKKTGAGMGKCKEALVATSGHLDEAERWLKIQGVKTEVLSRPTGEGAIAIKLSEDRQRVAMIELLCETDFAARGERFLKLADDIAEAVLLTPVGSITEALGLKVGEEVLHQVLHREISGVIKENLKLNHVTALNFTRRSGGIGTYVHSNRKLGVLVGITTDSPEHAAKPEFQQLLKDVALHIAGAANPPQYIYRNDITLAAVEAQSAIFFAQIDESEKDTIANAGKPRKKKPQEIREKIVAGKLNSYYKDVVLLEQPFIKDETRTIGALVEETSKAIGAQVKIDWFIRRTLGGN